MSLPAESSRKLDFHALIDFCRGFTGAFKRVTPATYEIRLLPGTLNTSMLVCCGTGTVAPFTEGAFSDRWAACAGMPAAISWLNEVAEVTDRFSLLSRRCILKDDTTR